MPVLPVGADGLILPTVKGDCPVFATGTITFMGLSGISMVVGAKAPGPAAPLVFYWHGSGSTVTEYDTMAAAVKDRAIAEGGVLVAFDASSKTGDASCSGNVYSLGDLDIGDQLVACAVRDHNIHPRRIYATGCSAGALFSACQGARRSSYMAAVATNSGGISMAQPFENTHTPALMTIHGASGSDVLGLDFVNTSHMADMSFEMHGGIAIDCEHGGGHCGGAGLAGDIWTFFDAHPFGVSPEPWLSALPAGFSKQCKIFR